MLSKFLNKLKTKKYILPILILVYYIFEFMAKMNILPNNMSVILEDSLLYMNRLVLLLALILVLYLTVKLVGRWHLFQNTARLFNVVIVLITFVVVSYIYTLNPFGASSLLNKFIYFNKTITINDFISHDEIHDFYLEEDLSLVSKNTDPWVVLYVDNYNIKPKNIKYINIDVENISKDQNIAEYYCFDYVDNVIDTDNIMLYKGSNIIKIKRFPELKCIRLDLTTEAFVNIKLKGVYINDSTTMLNVNTEYIKFTNKYLIFIASLLMVFILGNTYSKKEKKSNIYNMELWVLGFTSLAAVLNTLLLNSIISLILIIFIFFIYGFNTNYKEGNFSVKNINTLYIAVSLIILLCSINGLDMLVKLVSQTTQAEAIVNVWNIFWSALLASLIIGVFTAEDKKIYPVSYVISVFIIYYVIHTVVFSVYNSLSEIKELLYFIKYDNWSIELLIYGLFIMGLFTFILSLSGKRFTTICVMLFTFVSVTGNIIKLIYQGTYLKLADFIMLEELFGIMKTYIGNIGVLALALILITGIILIICNIKKIYKFLKFDTKLSLSISSTAVVLVLIANSLNGYSSLFADNINLREPDNYSKETMESIVAPYSNDKTLNEEKPDVILIMAESLFEVDKLPDISYNTEFTKNISKYKVADVISPRYGGGTAAVEFEALTGLTNYFFIDQMVAYNFYFSKHVPVNSLASEFKNNGYSTTAIHANTADFYHRDMVYEDMGFDEFYDIDSFDVKPEDLMNDGFTKDYLFFDKVVDRLEKGDENKFIFGVTIEGHSPYTNKFDKTDIKVKSDKLNENEIITMEQFSQTLKDLDFEIQKLVKYIKNREKPTLLYIWGDHLPPMSVYSKVGYFTNESYEKYRVPLIAYSNYTDLSIESKEISPTVITTEILKKSNIKYSSYFDYIADLQKKYPVMHKQFTNNNDELNNYYAIIYDILCGKNYLLK